VLENGQSTERRRMDTCRIQELNYPN